MSMTEQDEYPEGVELRDLDDFKAQRGEIFNTVMDNMKSVFPQSYGGVRMEVDDLHYADPEEYSVADQKKAILQDKYLTRRLRGTVRLFNEGDNTLLDEKKVTLMKVPYLTQRGTFIHGGKEYVSNIQARLIPGVYTRRQANGELETQFNVRPGSGNAFRVRFQPDTAQYRLSVRGADLHLYSLLKDLGTPDEQLAGSWGKEILDSNRERYDARVFEKAYQRLVPSRQQNPQATRDEKAQAIREALDASRINGTVARRNLPNFFDLSKSASWLQQWEGVKVYREMEKQAMAVMPFKPDFTPEEIQDSYNDLYGHIGPSLAGSRHWDQSRFHPELKEGWIQWYQQYHAGRRTEDDARQIDRWKTVKQLHGAQFLENPTPKRALTLRNWAIDAVKLLPITKALDFEKELEQYVQDQNKEYVRVQEKTAAGPRCPKCDKRPGTVKVEGDALVCGACGKASDMEIWDKKASEGLPVIEHPPVGLYYMTKLARYGAGILFKQPNGKYLLEENHDDGKIDKDLVGKLRPAGGGKSKRDANLRQTAIRELGEEFGLEKEEVTDKLKLLGYIKDGPYEGCAMFEMEGHGLKPGTYKATNSPTEKVKLVEATLDDPRYIGKKPGDLRRYSEKGYRAKSSSENEDPCASNS